MTAGRARSAVRAALFAAALGLILIPPLAVGLSANAAADPLWTALRIGALEALTLVFINIVTGSFRRPLAQVFKARWLHTAHQATGLLGFALALAHGLMALAFGIAGYSAGPVWIGPAVLVVLAAAILAALLRRNLRRSWRWIHRLNYLVFAAVLVHGLSLGSDLRAHTLLVVLVGVYAVVVTAGLVYRIRGGSWS